MQTISQSKELIYSICSDINSQLGNFDIFKLQNITVTKEQYQKFLVNKQNLEYSQIVAKSNNITVGILSIEKHPHFPFFVNFLYLSSVFVLPEYRHLGVGSRLTQESIKYADSKQCPVYLTTEAHKNFVNDFYVKNGFKRGGDWFYYAPEES